MTNIIKRDPFFRSFLSWPEMFEETAQKGLRIHETDKDIIIEAVVAGVPSEDVDIEIEDGVITVKAEKKEEEEKKGELRSSYYQYYYTTVLQGGQWDKAEAEVENGVLHLTIPKTEAARPRKISVKAKGKK